MTGESTLIDASLFPRLVVREGGRVVQEMELRGDLGIGRAEDNDLQLMDPKASRHHARIHAEGELFVLTDLDSANGTRVNGIEITAPHPLEHGDRIVIGDTELTYYLPGRADQDTIAVKGMPPAVQVAAATEVMDVPPPAQAPAKRPNSQLIGTIIFAAVAIVAIVAAIIFLPRLLGPEAPTPTVTVAGPTAPVQTEQPEASPEATVPPSTPVSSIDPAEMQDLLTQAEALTRRSKFEEAIAIYENLVSRAPEDARPEAGWAYTLILDDEAAQALPHAERAVELDAASSEAYAVLGRALAALGAEDQALPAAGEAVDLDPGSAQAHAVLAEAYLLAGQTQDAVDEADLALVQDINNADAHRIRGWLYYIADNDMGRAASELQIAAGLQPELWLRRHDLGVLLAEAEDYATAIIAFQDALRIRPKAITYTAIGEAYYELGQYDPARSSLMQAVSLGAENAQTLGLLAATLAQLDRCDEAEAYYEQVLTIDPVQPMANEAEDLCQGERPSPTPSATTASQSTATPEAEVTEEATSPPSSSTRLTGQIAFPVWNGETGAYDTYIANVDGSGRRVVASEMHQPAFRPDGAWLALNGERSEHMNLFVVRPDGSGLKEISQNLEDELPAWSPDGKSIVFSSRKHGDKQSRVYIIDEVVYEGGYKDPGRSLNFGPDDVRGEYPTWTADGRIVYSGCDITVSPARCGLFSMPAAPGVHPFKQLTENEEDSAPAAHGDKVAFMSNVAGNWEIYVMNLDGTGLKRLTNNSSIDGLPSWSPNGRSIAFVSDQGGAWGLWVMNADGSGRRKLFAIGGGGLAFDWQHERISWGP
jgi:tetratricopeptide (TPR) repeat protein